MQCLSTSSLIKEPLFTSGSGYDKESSQVHTFSPRRVVFLLLKALPSSKFASQKCSARGQSLDRGSPVRGKSNESLFFFTAWPTGRPAYLQVLNLNPTLAVLEGWRSSSTVYSSSLVIQGFVCYPFGLE